MLKFSQAHWECEASSESNSTPCGRLKLIFRDLKQPLLLAQEAGKEKGMSDIGQQE